MEANASEKAPATVQQAVAAAGKKEIADRERASVRMRTSRALRVVDRPRDRYGTWRVRSKESERTYEVLWPSEAVCSCSCPDARTSELSVCKHSAFVQGRAPKRGVPVEHCVVMVRARPSLGGMVKPLGDLQVYVPVGRAPAIAALTDPEGRPRSNVNAKEFHKALSQTHGVQWGEGVEALLESLIEGEAWRKRFARFERKVRAHLDTGAKAPGAWARMQLALTCTLRPYQVEGVLFAARERRALLADDMGLGKTLQAIATLVLLRELREPCRTLVVCPSSLKSQWKAEIEKFTAGSLRVSVLEGSRTERRSIVRNSDADVYILNFATLRNDLGELRALNAQQLIVDEAQRIKNWNTKTAKAVKSLRSPRVLALTGTPLENRLSDLHSVMELLDPRALGPLWRLMPEHALFSEVGGKVHGVRGLSLLRQRMGSRWLRRTKRDVLHELPERSDETKTVFLCEAQEVAHSRHMQRAAQILAQERLTQDDFLQLMSEMQRMRMICNGMALYLFDELEPSLDRLSNEQWLKRYPSPKLEAARDLLSGLVDSGEKVVVFSQWRRMLTLIERLIRPALEKRGGRCVSFHGGLHSAQRARAIDTFHSDPDAQVFLSTDAGGVGLNLQEAASMIVHLEVPWNPAVFEQRVGRVHRMGQREKVRVLTLMADDGIEPRVAAGLVQKQALFDGIFDGADELSFGERESFMQRMKNVLGVPPRAASESLVRIEQPVDATTCLVPGEVPLVIDDVGASHFAQATDRSPRDQGVKGPPQERAASTEPRDQVVKGPLHASTASTASSQAESPDAEEVEVRMANAGPLVSAYRNGSDVRIHMAGVGSESWVHLKAFLESLAA